MGLKFKPIVPDTPFPDVEFRKLMESLSRKEYMLKHLGERSSILNRFWNVTKMMAYQDGMMDEEVEVLFMQGYNEFEPTKNPWEAVSVLMLVGWSDERDDPRKLIPVAGQVFAAYTIEV